MSIRPSETSQGIQWLANFRLDEHRAATLLIDNLRVISTSHFRTVMSNALGAVIDEIKEPVGVYPVRELPSQNSDVRFPPLDHPFTPIPGSEGLVGNLIRDVIGRKPRFNRAAYYRTVEKLRQHRVRTLLFVDDYSGTGDQIINYVDAWMHNPTVKSWHS